MGEQKTNYWHWIEQDAPYETDKIQGKYLFYSPKQKPLLKVARIEVQQHGFPVAKVVTKTNKMLKDYVLCLYDYEEKKDEDMLNRFMEYTNTHRVRYERWKSEEETKNFEYEPEFYEKLIGKYLSALKEASVGK